MLEVRTCVKCELSKYNNLKFRLISSRYVGTFKKQAILRPVGNNRPLNVIIKAQNENARRLSNKEIKIIPYQKV